MSDAPTTTQAAPATPDNPVRAVCHLFLAFDVAMSIDLAHAQRLLSEHTSRPNLSSRFRTPDFIAYQPAPLRVTQSCPGVPVGAWTTGQSVETTLFDFGVASVAYRIGFDAPLSGLAAMSDSLQDHPGFRDDARARVQSLCEAIAPAMRRAALATPVEDYAVFVLDPASLDADAPTTLARHAPAIARVLRGNVATLSDQEISDAVAARLSFTRDDAAVIDWSAAVLIDQEPSDVLAILEFASVELLEMRLLDDRLDATLSESFDTISRRRWWTRPLMGGSRDLRRLASMQTDAALMFEGVNNAIKLVGDQYLARLYRAAASRMGVPEWQASVRRKLATLESIQSRVAEHGASFRMEIIEWIVVFLILFEVVLTLARW